MVFQQNSFIIIRTIIRHVHDIAFLSADVEFSHVACETIWSEVDYTNNDLFILCQPSVLQYFSIWKDSLVLF